VLAQPAPAVAVSATLIPHLRTGLEDCLLCHATDLAQAMPDDHAARGNSTCTACHDWQPTAAPPSKAGTAGLGEAIWLTRAEVSCRNCHGALGEGGFGPPLANTQLDADTFLSRARTPQSGRMPPIASAPDDPVFERSGAWISDNDLRLVHAWLTGQSPVLTPTAEEALPPAVPHEIQGFQDCLLCHSSGMAEAFPDDHAGRTSSMCLVCHPTGESQ